jgi:hypothetical protein
MLITVEGLYKDGRIELLERPDGIEQARVLVTLLPEVATSSTRRVPKIAGVLAKQVSLEAAEVDPIQNVLDDLKRERSARHNGFDLHGD